MNGRRGMLVALGSLTVTRLLASHGIQRCLGGHSFGPEYIASWFMQ